MNNNDIPMGEYLSIFGELKIFIQWLHLAFMAISVTDVKED